MVWKGNLQKIKNTGIKVIPMEKPLRRPWYTYSAKRASLGGDRPENILYK